MTRRPLVALGLFALLGLAACGGGGGSTAGVAPSAAPSVAGEAPCAPTADAGTVAVAIADFAFSPKAITAKVGDVISFTNGGAAPHSATLDEGDCGTEVLNAGTTGGLSFAAAGTYPFHCSIHAAMTGTIEVSE